MKEYKTITEYDIKYFDAQVNSMISNGWEIDEPMVVTPVPSSILAAVTTKIYYSQRFFKLTND